MTPAPPNPPLFFLLLPPLSSSSSLQPSHTDHHHHHQPQQQQQQRQQQQQLDPYALLSKPTWSVRALLPRSTSPPQPAQGKDEQDQDEPAVTVTRDQLRHLLRLSALPPAGDEAEAGRLLADLEAQLGFVRDVRRVDTAGVEPLRAIRDETAAGLREAAVTVDVLRHALAEEEVVGRCRRPRRRRGAGQKEPIEGVEDWDVLGCAAERVGRYFVVRSGKDAAASSDGVAHGVDGGS
ncbi:hypothetical protein VTH06DRAFT_1424 [Thermothelomyces fergusii]